jgi:predicted PurR-regulated permease PerM
MNKLQESYNRRKDWYLLATFSAALVLMLLNRGSIASGFGQVKNAISPLVYGIVFAFILNVPMSFIEDNIKKYSKNKLKSKRVISIILTYVVVLIILTLLLVVVIPQLIETITTLANNASSLVSSLSANINSITDFFHVNFNLDLTTAAGFEDLANQLGISIESISANIQNLLDNFGTGIINSLQNFGSGLYNIFMGLIVAVYLLAAKETFIRQIKKTMICIFSKKIGNIVLNNTRIVIDIFKHFISGQLLEAIIIGALVFLTMTVLKLPYALIIGCIVAVLAIIPIFGNIIAMIIGSILILAVDPWQALYFIIAYQVIQQLENSLIYPRVVGSSVGLPAIWTLLAVAIFGGLAGLGGMLIGVPVTASVYTLGSKLVRYIITRKKIMINEDGYFESIKEISEEKI